MYSTAQDIILGRLLVQWLVTTYLCILSDKIPEDNVFRYNPQGLGTLTFFFSLCGATT